MPGSNLQPNTKPHSKTCIGYAVSNAFGLHHMRWERNILALSRSLWTHQVGEPWFAVAPKLTDMCRISSMLPSEESVNPSEVELDNGEGAAEGPSPHCARSESRLEESRAFLVEDVSEVEAADAAELDLPADQGLWSARSVLHPSACLSSPDEHRRGASSVLARSRARMSSAAARRFLAISSKSSAARFISDARAFERCRVMLSSAPLAIRTWHCHSDLSALQLWPTACLSPVGLPLTSVAAGAHPISGAVAWTSSFQLSSCSPSISGHCRPSMAPANRKPCAVMHVGAGDRWGT